MAERIKVTSFKPDGRTKVCGTYKGKAYEPGVTFEIDVVPFDANSEADQRSLQSRKNNLKYLGAIRPEDENAYLTNKDFVADWMVMAPETREVTKPPKMDEPPARSDGVAPSPAAAAEKLDAEDKDSDTAGESEEEGEEQGAKKKKTSRKRRSVED